MKNKKNTLFGDIKETPRGKSMQHWRLRQLRERTIWVEGHPGRSGGKVKGTPLFRAPSNSRQLAPVPAAQQVHENGTHISYGPVSLDTIKSTLGSTELY